MFRSILAITLSWILFGCGGGGGGNSQGNTVNTDDHIDISKICPTNMVCDFFDAPKDYYSVSGETVKIHYAVHKATDSENRIGILVFNFGGPGAESVNNTNWMITEELPAEILAKFDIVGMDPRGSGQSVYAQELTDCAVAESKGEGNCNSVYEAIAPYVGSNSVVKDLDQLRSVLGEDKLNLFGYSYGTRLGSLYANMYPENVRAIVLDSPMTPNEENHFESVKGKITGFDLVIDYRLGFDSDLKNRLVAIFNEADNTGSYTGSDGVTLNYSQLDNIFYALYSAEYWQNWSNIKEGVFELLNNNNVQLLKSQEPKIQWGEQSNEQRNDSLRSGYLFQLVSCTDEITPLSSNEIINRGSEYETIAPLFADLAKDWSTKCSQWSMQRDPIAIVESMENVLSDQQVLIIGGQYDTNTHYKWAEEMVASFGDLAAFITVDNLADHGFSYTGLSCVDKNTTQYLLDPTINIADETCSGTPPQRKTILTDKQKDHPVKRTNPTRR